MLLPDAAVAAVVADQRYDADHLIARRIARGIEGELLGSERPGSDGLGWNSSEAEIARRGDTAPEGWAGLQAGHERMAQWAKRWEEPPDRRFQRRLSSCKHTRFAAERASNVHRANHDAAPPAVV